VIGGGDTGSDCIGTSNRHGARSVTQIEILDKPPAKEDKGLTWPDWPNKLRTSSSQEEGCERHWNVLTKEFLGDAEGRVRAVRYCLVRWDKDASGRWQMSEVPGSEAELKADLVLLAMGFVHPVHQGMLEVFSRGGLPRPRPGLELDLPRGNVKAATEGARGLPDLRRPGSSPLATCAAASRWWSGPSAKAEFTPMRPGGGRVADGGLMTLPKDAITLCGTPVSWEGDESSEDFFGTRPGYVYTAKANYVECSGPTGYKEDHRSYFYSANISTGASCKYAARMKPTPTATTYTTNVQLISANEIASQNGDAIKDVMMTMWTPASTYLGSVIIDPATCTELKSNTYSVGTL
jgi:hypothetical protein